MTDIFLAGYCDRFSVKPGETLRFMATAEGATQAEVQLVRLIHGDENPEGPGFIEREVDAPINGPQALQRQRTQVGSFVRVADADGRLAVDGPVTLWAFIWPTLLGRGRQGLLTRWSAPDQQGYALSIDEGGRLEFRVGGAETEAIAADAPLFQRQWYFVAATFEPESGRACLYQEPIENRYGNHLSKIVPLEHRSHVEQSLQARPERASAGFLLAGVDDMDGASELYNGKIDRCGVIGEALSRDALDALRTSGTPASSKVIAQWDTAAGYTATGIGDRVVDVGPYGLEGLGVNRPVRAMTGYNWNGRDDCFRVAPEQFGGIYFHDDAIIDCGWASSFEMVVPSLKSGVYAARLRAGDAEEHIPFFVRPAAPSAPIAMLMPTCSYLAYANERLGSSTGQGQAITAHVPMFHQADFDLAGHPSFGASNYDAHSDGAGVCYSSRLRPILNLRPKHRTAGVGIPWQFPADLSIIYWLETKGYDYDVITDEDLHQEGVACLTPYNVVINGTHAEYYSEPMMDATEDYLAGGGRIMYLSGNGYYWVVGFRDGDPTCMEMRRLESGSRAWQASAGEHYMASNAERGGLWRSRGRAPQKLVGTGFTSEGMDESKPYRRMPDADDPSVAWILDGVDGETFGAEGLALGGAAGVEIDRYDLALGTPPQTKVIASSEGHSDNYPLVVEDIWFNLPGLGGTQDHRVRADMTYFTTPNNGAVWSASSIAWGQALPCNDGDNDVSRVMANVLDAFMKDGPLPGSD